MNTAVKRTRRKPVAARGKRLGAAASSSSPEMCRDSASDADVSAADISAADTGKAEESKSETSVMDINQENHKGTAIFQRL